MGVILKVLHRGEDLKKAPHRNLFLDMEENIHIHYRDLRIELSRKEFEDIVRTFSLQSAELMKIIQDTNYRDGVLPNANHDEHRIWTESRLENEVVYHPTRISLEECTDGYHLHLRNYKFLLDREDFTVLVNAFRAIDLDTPYAGTLDEVLELLEANHLHYDLREKKADGGRVRVASYHEVKVRSILTGIGMARKVANGLHIYTKDELRIEVEISRDRSDFADRFEGAPRTVVTVTEVLESDRVKDTNWLNAIKARVLDTVQYLRKSGRDPNVNLDYRSWLYDSLYDEVIFPFTVVPQKIDARQAYRKWSAYLKERDLFFVKPTKAVFGKPKQVAVYNKIMDRIQKEIAVIPAVSKVHLMGSAARGDLGVYKSPFIHSEWSKLASDVDLLIEMDEEVPFDVPENWTYINVSTTNQCDIYHIGEIPVDDLFGNRRRFPNIDHFAHLLDAYVYFPSKGDVEKKDAFLERFKAKVVYDRGRDQAIRRTLVESFGDTVGPVRKLDVATENFIFETEYDGRPAILKVYKVSGNYSSSRLAEHAVYECALIEAIRERGVPTAGVLKTVNGESVFEIEEDPAVLFEKLVGTEVVAPDYPVSESASALAKFHAVQIDSPIEIEHNFSFDSVFDLWRVEFDRFAGEYKHDDDVTAAFSDLGKTYSNIEKTYSKLNGRKNVPWVHNHGDVQPRNVIMIGGEAHLFDLQNAFYGPRLLDVVEGGIEFSWGFKNPKDNDFARFDRFVEAYTAQSSLSSGEKACLNDAIRIVGLIKFLKEVRMIKGDKNKNNLRRMRALDLAAFMAGRLEAK